MGERERDSERERERGKDKERGGVRGREVEEDVSMEAVQCDIVVVLLIGGGSVLSVWPYTAIFRSVRVRGRVRRRVRC